MAGFAEAMASYEAHWSNKIMSQTFGHLAPTEGVHYGVIVVGSGLYGDKAIITNTFDLPDSPWFYEAMYDMIWRATKDQYKEEDVVEWIRCRYRDSVEGK